VVGSQKVPLNQAGAPCRFDLSRSRDSVGPAGGQLAVDVTTLSGCQWAATSDVGWIVVSSGQTGNASGRVGLTVGANTGAERVGSVKIAGQNFSVTQDAVPPPAPAPGPAPAPTPAPPGPAPSPPPPTSTQVQFQGTVSGLSGRCPDLSFMAGGRRVVANRNTDYKHGKCTDLSNGDRLTIAGTTIGDTVTAKSIDLTGSNGD
jgi:hypothetical protein